MYMLSLTWQLGVLKCRSPDLWPQIYVSEFLQWSSRRYSPNISYYILQYRSGMIFNFGRTCCSFARMTQQKILIFILDYLRFSSICYNLNYTETFQSAYADMICLSLQYHIDQKKPLQGWHFEETSKLNCNMFAKLGYVEQNLEEIVEKNAMKKS